MLLKLGRKDSKHYFAGNDKTPMKSTITRIQPLNKSNSMAYHYKKLTSFDG